jgi:hypothetical protein
MQYMDEEAATAIKAQEEQDENESATAVVPAVALRIQLTSLSGQGMQCFRIQSCSNALRPLKHCMDSCRITTTVLFAPIGLLGKNGEIAAALKRRQANLTSGSNHKNRSSSLGLEQQGCSNERPTRPNS